MGCDPASCVAAPATGPGCAESANPYVSLARALLQQDQTKEEQTMRWIGLDCHLEYIEVAILDTTGGLVSAGRIESSEEAIGLFAEGLAADDRVALESSANAAAIAALIRPYAAKVAIAAVQRLTEMELAGLEPGDLLGAIQRICWPLARKNLRLCRTFPCAPWLPI
jgi:hypothetical protein